MMNILVAGMILVIFGAAVTYIYKEKKRGVTCIGCPNAAACAANRGGVTECSCGCQTH